MEALDRTVRRFPLVARTKPACPALDVRIREVSNLASAAGSATGFDQLALSAEAHNKAALIASDCGMPGLARSLCWRQFHVYECNRPLTARAARFALEPIANVARLLIRQGEGESAHELLETLYQAVRTGTEAVIDSTPLTFRDLTDSAEDHRALCLWLWTVLLADGTRALAAAGRWEQALAHAEQRDGVGRRLLDGRQVAILAHCLAGDPASALADLEATATPTSWERCVAGCLTVLCLMSSARPTARAVTEMVERYLELQHGPGLLLFRCRLGQSVIDLAGEVEQAWAEYVARDLASHAMASGDGYAARELLMHEGCRTRLADRELRALYATLQSAGLGRGAIPGHLMEDLLSAVHASEAVAALHLFSVTQCHDREAAQAGRGRGRR